jgi:hypothetical protein
MMFSIWIPFLRRISLVTGLLALVAFGMQFVLSTYRLDLGLIAIAVMALNAIGAVGPLHWLRNQNPIHVYMLSLVVRMAAIGGFTIALVLQSHFSATDAFSFVFTAMVGFVVFTIFEIRHLIRHQSVLLANPSAKPSVKPLVHPSAS